MSFPLIGVTTARSLTSKGISQVGVLESYIKALTLAGAYPLLIPLSLPVDGLSKLLSRLDGLLLTGGGDIHPDQYGSKHHPKVSNIDEDRDRIEIELFQEVVSSNLPFLGICRGLQVVNVALGGTLYEDLGDQLPGSLKHDCWTGYPPDYLAHPVEMEKNSMLAGILDFDMMEVNSLHHQGIRELAPQLNAVAYAPDGLIEAIELPSHSFGLAVQWHPEWLQGNLAMRALFSDFVMAASRDL